MDDVELRDVIVGLGGLVSRAGIARRLKLSRTRAVELSKASTFPFPVGDVDGHPVWVWEHVRQWRENGRNPS